MVPAYFVIGDSLPFRADNVQSGRDGTPLPDADVSYSLIDAQTRSEITDGDMTLYDEPNASFEAVIPDEDLELYDEDDNPNGVVPNREYLLRTTVDNEGVKTSRTMRLLALLDPPEQE